MPIATTTAALIAGGMAGGNILGGFLGSRGAKNAAEIQAAMAARIAEMARQEGERSTGKLEEAGAHTEEAARNAAQGVEETARNAASDLRGVSEGAAAGVREGAVSANELLRGLYQSAEEGLSPYRAAGADAVTKLGTAADRISGLADEKFTFAADDPSFQFRMKEGQKALERSAALRGGALGGSALKSLTKYSQDVASTEYQKAFDRFQADRAARAGLLRTGSDVLGNVAGLGLKGTEDFIGAGNAYGGRASENITGAAKTVGDFLYGGAKDAGGFLTRGSEFAGNTRLLGARELYGAQNDAAQLRMRALGLGSEALAGGANARAAGEVGGANAWSNAISNASRAPIDYITMRQFLQPRPTWYPYPIGPEPPPIIMN